MRSEAFASPDHDSDDKRPSKKGQPPEGIAEGTRQSSAEPTGVRDSIFPSEAHDLSNVSPFPTEVVSHPASQAAQPYRAPAASDRDPIAQRGAVDAASQPKARNWRNIFLAVLGLAVIGQAALIGYWLLSGGGLAALTNPNGSISVTSEPSGSQVTIDGAVRGQTPLTIALAPGAHTVVVGAGEQARSQNITVVRARDASMHVQLPATIVAPEAAAKTALQVASEPGGARVWIDGEFRGVAPLTVPNMSPGEHVVTVRSGSGDPINRTVTVQQGTTASLVITMPASTGASFASGYLTIQSPLALQVMEKGALLGTTDMPRIMVSAGEHELELVNSALGYRATRTVTVAAGQTATFSVIPPRGTLSINALPWAEVWIDGARVGETPIGNYSIPIGTHELLFRHPELGEQRKTVAVSAQGPVRIGVDMKKP